MYIINEHSDIAEEVVSGVRWLMVMVGDRVVNGPFNGLPPD